MAGEEVEEVPLRHQRDEFARRRHMAEIGDIEVLVPDDDAGGAHFLVGQLEELAEQAELAEQFERGRMHGVAAKVAEEVLVLFQYGDFHASARQQVAEHDAGRPSAYYTAIRS